MTVNRPAVPELLPAHRTTARRTSTAASSNSRHDVAEPTPNLREEDDDLDRANAMECEDPTTTDFHSFQNFTDGDDNMLSSLRKRYEATEPAAMRPNDRLHARGFHDGDMDGLHTRPCPDRGRGKAEHDSIPDMNPDDPEDKDEVAKEMKESILWRRCLSCLGSLQPSQDDVFSQKLLGSIGYFQTRTTISEIYYPPRVTVEIVKSKNEFLTPGLAFDITVDDPDDGQPWDFNVEAKREKAREILRKQKPYLLIGSPMCTAFCFWQRLNAARWGNTAEAQAARTKAVKHMEFAASLYFEQLQAGRYFLHEHPRYASSWGLSTMEELMKIPGVELTHGDQCQYGARVARGPLKGRPVKKPSGFLSNSRCLSRALSRTCSGTKGACSRGGQHAQCSGRIAREAAIYLRELCQAVIKGIVEQLKEDRLLKSGCFGVQVPDDEEEIESLCQEASTGYSGKFKDDITGQVLLDELVLEARRVELDFFNKKGV